MIFDPNFILKIPPVWPDEALNADVALNILNNHPAGTELLNITLPGAKEFGFGYPPLFFYLVAFWFKIFNFSILTQRILTITVSGVFLFILYKLLKLLFKKRVFPFLAIGLLISDFSFLKASIISRPEIVVLLLGTLSTYLLLKSEDYKDKKKLMLSFISGFICGIGFLFHYLAIIFISSLLAFMLLKYRLKFFRQKTVLTFTLGAFLPIVSWLFIIRGDLHYLINDLTLRWQYGVNEIIWVRNIFSGENLILKIVYIIYMVILLDVINAFFVSRTTAIKLFTILLTFSWIFTYFWHTEYAFICTILATYLAFAGLIYENKNRYKKIIYTSIFVLLLILNTSNLRKEILNVSGDKYNYNSFIKSILSAVPDKKTVYLSSIPDAYYAFRPNRSNKLYEFPVLPTSQEKLLKVLSDSDYIIYNSSLETLVTENTVSAYMQKYGEQTIKIRGKDQYSASIVKLVPKNQRL